jgi:hypothetical protein
MECLECADLVHKFMPNPESDQDKSRKASMLTSCIENSTCRVAYEKCGERTSENSLADCSRTFEACAQPCIMDSNVTAHITSWCSGLTELSKMRNQLSEGEAISQERGVSVVSEKCREFVKEHYTLDNSVMDYICGSEGLAFKPRWQTSCEPKIQGIHIDGCTVIVKGTIDEKPVMWNVAKTSHCHDNHLKFVAHTHFS